MSSTRAYDHREDDRQTMDEEREFMSGDGGRRVHGSPSVPGAHVVAPKDEMPRTQKLIVLAIWLGSLGFLAFYVANETTAFLNAGVTTRVSIFAKDTVEFPAITLCNFEANVTLTPHNDSCQVLTTNGSSQACPMTKVPALAPYDCYTINGDPGSVFSTSNIGLRGQIRSRLYINRANYTGSLYGVQVVLHNATDPPDINTKTFFVAPGRMSIVALRRLETIPINATSDSARQLSWEFEMQYAAVPDGDPLKDDLVSVGFIYKELSVQEVEEIWSYTRLDYFGIVSGMVGVMLGFDVFGVSLMVTKGSFDIFSRCKGK